MATAPRVPHVNVTRTVPTKQAEAARAADVQGALARLTAMDQVVYEAAVRRFKEEEGLLFQKKKQKTFPNWHSRPIWNSTAYASE
jgi:anti-sigma-K factor RskA